MVGKFDTIRNSYMEKIREMLSVDDEVLTTGTNEFCLPICNDNGEEGYLVLTFKIPKGSRDGDPYDGYAMAEEYQMKVAEKLAKAEAKEKAKAKKIAKDKARRVSSKKT